MYMQNSSSNNLFGSFNNQGNNANKGIFGNANVQSNLSNTDHSSIFGVSKTPQSNNALVNKNLFNMNTSSSGLSGNKGLYDNMNSQSNLGNKNIFGGSSVGSGANQGNMGGNNLFMNSSNQSGLGMKNIFGGTTNLNAPGTNMSNKGIFGGMQQNNQSSAPSSSNLFGNLSSNQTSSGNMFGNLSSANQNKGNSLFGTSSQSNQTAGSNMFGNASPMGQNKGGGLFGALQSSNQGSTSSSMFGGAAGGMSQNKGSSTLFGGMSGSTPTNAGSGNLFGNASPMNQNKPSGGLFGAMQTPTQGSTSNSMFGSAAGGMSQNKGSSIFGGSFGTANQGSTQSNMFGNASSMGQNKGGGLFGALQTPTQGSTSSSMFGGAAGGMSQNKGSSTLFGGMSGSTPTNTGSGNLFGNTSPMSQNKPGGVFGNLQSPSQGTTSSSNMFGGLGASQAKPATGGNLFGGMSSTPGTSATTGTGSNLFGGTVQGSQNKTGSNIFGSLSGGTQAGSSSSLFGATPSPSATTMGGNNVFSPSMTTPTSQNKFNNLFGQVGTAGQSTSVNSAATTGASSTPGLGGATQSGSTSNMFGSVSTGTNLGGVGDSKNIFGTSSGFSLGAGNTGTNATTGVGGVGTGLSTGGVGLGVGSNLGTTMGSSVGTNMGTNLGSNLASNMNATLNAGGGTGTGANASGSSIFGGLGGLNSNLGGGTMMGSSGLGQAISTSAAGGAATNMFMGNKTLGPNNSTLMSTQNNLLLGEKGKVNSFMAPEFKSDQKDELAGSKDNLDKSVEELTIIKKQEGLFDEVYEEEDAFSEKESEGTFYNYINLIINDNINDIQKTTFSLLNDHDSLMWDNFKSNIFKNFVDYLVNFKQKKNQKVVKSNVLDLDQHEFQILIWLYNVNACKVDFIPFKSFYYLLLSDTNLNYSKIFIGNVDKNLFPGSFVEVNDHYYMNSKNHFFKSQISKYQESEAVSVRDRRRGKKRGTNAININALDVDSIYKQVLKDILNSLLNMNLSITKENLKRREKEDYYDNGDNHNNYSSGNGNVSGRDKLNSGPNYTYENLLLNYLFGTLQHLHDKFYKIEISNYVAKDLNQIDEYFVDAKSNAIFSYCYDNFYKNEMDKENCTIHFFFYLVNIMFRCGNYLGLIQIIKGDEFVKNLSIDNYLYDFVILLIRILFLIYHKSNEISIFENMKVDFDCTDIFKKKINMSVLINFFHSIIYLCVNNIYAYDLLCVLFSDIFYKKGSMYTNRDKKMEMKNIFHYTEGRSPSHENTHEEDGYDDVDYDDSFHHHHHHHRDGRMGPSRSGSNREGAHPKGRGYEGEEGAPPGKDPMRGRRPEQRSKSQYSDDYFGDYSDLPYGEQYDDYYGERYVGPPNNGGRGSRRPSNHRNGGRRPPNYDLIDDERRNSRHSRRSSRNRGDDNSNNNNQSMRGYFSSDENSNSGRAKKGKKGKNKTFFFDMFTNMLQKPKKSQEDEFGNIEINEEMEDRMNRDSEHISYIESLGITNRYGYNFEYCNIETSIWIELTLFLSKNFDLYGSKFQENFDILDTNLSFYNYDDDNNAILNDTKYRREKINGKIEKLFICISHCIVHENKEFFAICSKLKVDEVINNFIVVDGKIAEKVKGNISKVLKNNFVLYIKLFYYLLLVGNIYTTVAFLSCISNNVQRILLVLTIFLHKNNIFENEQLNNIKLRTLQFLKFKNESDSFLDHSMNGINDEVSSAAAAAVAAAAVEATAIVATSAADRMNLINLSLNSIDLPFDYFVLRNNNINILLKITYLLNLKTSLSIKLLKSIVQENQDILLHESVIGHINNDGNILYGKLHDFLFLFKNKVKMRKDIKCYFLMYYVLYKKKLFHSTKLRKYKNENDEEYHYKCRNFKYVQSKNINTLNRISLDNSFISVHCSILYKISQFYAILAYFANQRKNYIISFICYYILKDEQSAINSLIRIYNDELIYYYHNNEREYVYIRKCAFRFYHLAKNMWPSNVKLESIENKSYLILSILFMKRKMFEEAFIIFSSSLIPDNMLEKLSTADYYNIDLSSNFLMTLRELCRQNYQINELVGQTTLHAVVKFLLPIKDKLDAQVVESINYLSTLSF
ncbi:unnamed protein product [Plasmodium vivax]|uniref:Nucleoporin NUP100/NSP100 n=4 Tax=Plasmodium vivax TaxID=5855 RepID=A5K6C2_PLAVS|nr:hypothetical protein, conserved [Plasmodium vivax]KMZ81316.1 hypothetical protein PVIIG_02743 [Plasmodium vivax India VII]KMZ87537.1 hypothetical protein PVBG_04875 [Plasmodium vivax Brazil I]EDL44863.1 hypothetical protein, conserved [Plasmodium vivax]CAG9480320.1 unnamed protein product [Plasmodium vivax]CAI7719490.1 nucleoporin NUP221, putative [Plasmodium vivax]|eukprot:XP_001614590.1 hypothetical protein [Plasmodium vivax Sal-1]